MPAISHLTWLSATSPSAHQLQPHPLTWLPATISLSSSASSAVGSGPGDHSRTTFSMPLVARMAQLGWGCRDSMYSGRGVLPVVQMQATDGELRGFWTSKTTQIIEGQHSQRGIYP